MNKIKTFMLEHKVFFTVLFVAIALLGLEYVVVNNYVDKKTSPKKNKTSNITSNLSDKQKKTLGIASNSNNAAEENNSVTNTIIEEKKEKKKEELSNSNVNKNYIEYEKKSEEEKKKIEVIPSKEKVDINKLEELDTKKTGLPEKFDLNDIITFNYQTQGTYGICWDFASTKVFESYLELRDKKHYNFSEIAVDYLASEYVYNFHGLHNAGNFNTYNEVLHKFGGLVEEKNVTQDYYHDYTVEEFLNMFNLPKVKIEGYENVHFPTIYYDFEKNNFMNDDKEVTEAELEEYRTAMKNHLMNNSALYVSVYVHDTSGYDSKLVTNKDELADEKYSNIDRNNALYCGGDYCTSDGPHAMTIVGWDDNFDRRFFRSRDSKTGKLTNMAEHNGAFIAVNSYSTSKDLYYISYDYPYLYEDINGIKTFDTTKGYDLNQIKNTKFKNALLNQFSSSVVYLNNSIYLPYSEIDDTNYMMLDNITLTLEDTKVLSMFKNIHFLTFDNVTLPSTNFLSNFSKIEMLSINNSNISDLSSISSLKDLYILDLDNNNITDITPLENLNKLESLSLANNNITDISALKNLSILVDLDLSNNKIVVNNDSFTSLVELESLNLKNCGVNSLTLNSNIIYNLLELSDNPNIQLTSNISVNNLYIDNNNLNNLDILSKIDKEKIYVLSAKNNNISDVQILSNYKNLGIINLSYNKNITDFSPIVSLFKVEKKDNTNNAAASVFFGILNSFNKKYDEEEHIEVPENEDDYSEKYGYLYFNGCNISDISIFNDANITILELADNNITSVENFKNDNVTLIDLSNNKLGNTNLSSLFTKEMTEIYLSNNEITELNFEIKNDYIETLDLSKNDITDISKLENKDISILSLEKNSNFKNYSKDMQVNILNVSDTSIDESIIENLKLDKLYSLNISSNKKITDYSLFLDKLSEQSKKYNKEINDNDPDRNNYGFEEKDYIDFDVILNDEIMKNSKYYDDFKLFANYELNKNTMSNIVNIATSEFYPIFKIVNAYYDVIFHNIDVNSDGSKIILKDELDSYIEYSNRSIGISYRVTFN